MDNYRAQFYFAAAKPWEIEAMCAAFNRHVQTLVSRTNEVVYTKPRAQMGSGITGDCTVLILSINDYPLEGVEDFDYLKVEPLMQQVAAEHKLTFEKK